MVFYGDSASTRSKLSQIKLTESDINVTPVSLVRSS